jgi:hypothetical protein
MKETRSFASLFVTAVFLLTIFLVGTPLNAQSAKGQLDSFGNTGAVFDGSDGKRFGMDTQVTKSGGKVPDASPPSKVETSSGTAGGYSVGTSTGTASGNTGSGTTSGQKSKTGTEKAH